MWSRFFRERGKFVVNTYASVEFGTMWSWHPYLLLFSKRAYVVGPEVIPFQHLEEESESTPNLDAPRTLMRISRNARLRQCSLIPDYVHLSGYDINPWFPLALTAERGTRHRTAIVSTPANGRLRCSSEIRPHTLNGQLPVRILYHAQ